MHCQSDGNYTWNNDITPNIIVTWFLDFRCYGNTLVHRTCPCNYLITKYHIIKENFFFYAMCSKTPQNPQINIDKSSRYGYSANIFL